MAQAPFIPRYISPPGDTIVDRMDELSMSTDDFVDAMHITAEAAYELFEGIMLITGPMCDDLSRILGSTPNFWYMREELYRARLARA